jgi:zinc transport system substrate-binding protein
VTIGSDAKVRTILILIMAGVLLAGVATACGGSDGDGSRRRVVAAFYPLAYAAEQIGGATVDVENLTPPGVEPHDLEIKPRDVARIRSADLVLLMGERFQPQVDDAAGEGDRVLRVLDLPGLRVFPDSDPHVWLDPIRYAVIGRRIAATLARPGRGRAFARRLQGLDVELRRGLAHCRSRDLVTSHAAFAYLAARYRLRQVPITGLSPEAEPTPGELADAIEAVRESGATTVFFEPLVSRRIAETVARETGARTAVLDPIEGLTSDEARQGDDYFTLMRANLRALREGLGCR